MRRFSVYCRPWFVVVAACQKPKKKLSIFFDFFGKLDVDFKVWKVVALKH